MSRVLIILSMLGATFVPVLLTTMSHAKGPTPAVALSGHVSSAAGFIEGVVVSAKRAGGTTTVAVVSDAHGYYSFPTRRLLPGRYDLSIRSVGYDLPRSRRGVVITNTPVILDFRLNSARDLSLQLSSAEWLASIPGTSDDKDEVYKCVLCHTATPIMTSKYDAAGWMATINRMRNYGPASEFNKPQVLPFHQLVRPDDAAFAKYLASINLSSKPTWDFELKAFPRPRGEATKVMITEYDLPRPDAQPHDAVIDSDGMIWYDDFAEPILGRLDPKTGKTREWHLPEIRPGFPGGCLDLELDQEGNPWVAMLLQAGVARFDKKTEQITTWTLPKEYSNPKSRVPFLAFGINNHVWFVDTWNRTMYLLDVATGQIDRFPAYPGWKVPEIDLGSGAKGKTPRGHFIYGINSDSKGMGYFADMAGGNIGEVDPKTAKVKLFPTPSPNSGPRRMHFDSDNKLWFAENYALKIGSFDPQTDHFREWDDPTPWDGPYDTVRDKMGYVWAGGMTTDLVTRLNPASGQITQYLLPTLGANIRRVDVDNSTHPPSFIVGENHQAKIAIVQPLR
jgi:streptogramin lyase